jgi:hypothetical protein
VQPWHTYKSAFNESDLDDLFDDADEDYFDYGGDD